MMTDSYYELVDDADPRGEQFRATDLQAVLMRRRTA
jgi:hypothetical protein